ncbi:hypothetical protein MIDIC_170035 [Alphaproteobacteria bacterium]
MIENTEEKSADKSMQDVCREGRVRAVIGSSFRFCLRSPQYLNPHVSLIGEGEGGTVMLT